MKYFHMLYIAKNIKALRADKKLSQARLASQLGIVPGTISNYENEVSTPDFEILEKITKILGVSAHDLLYEDLSKGILETKTPKKFINRNDEINDELNDEKPKLQKSSSSEGEIFKTKSTKNATLSKGGEMGGEKGGIPKLPKTPPFNDVDSILKPTHKITVHGAGAPYAMSNAEPSQLNEPDAPYVAEITTDPSLITVDDFVGLTTEEINAEFDGAMQEAVLEMFQAGLIVSGPMVQQMEQRYKEEIRDLTTKLVRLECQHEMVQAELSKLRRKKKRAADEERTGQEKR